jgi:hypothetical protein
MLINPHVILTSSSSSSSYSVVYQPEERHPMRWWCRTSFIYCEPKPVPSTQSTLITFCTRSARGFLASHVVKVCLNMERGRQGGREGGREGRREGGRKRVPCLVRKSPFFTISDSVRLFIVWDIHRVPHPTAGR